MISLKDNKRSATYTHEASETARADHALLSRKAAAFQDRWWFTEDGLRLYARDYPASPGRVRLPVICLHGLTRNSADFEEVAGYIAKLDQRGLSARPVVARIDQARCTSDRDPRIIVAMKVADGDDARRLRGRSGAASSQRNAEQGERQRRRFEDPMDQGAPSTSTPGECVTVGAERQWAATYVRIRLNRLCASTIYQP